MWVTRKIKAFSGVSSLTESIIGIALDSVHHESSSR
jgi:hypothetical protein